MPINNFYNGDDSQWILRQIHKDLERKRIAVEAMILNNKLKSIKKNFKSNAKTVLSTTKTSISSIEKEMDTAIKGKERNKIGELVDETLPKYDNVF